MRLLSSVENNALPARDFDASRLKARVRASVASAAREGVAQKAGWLKLILVFAFASGFYISRRLWTTSERMYPTAPVFDFLPATVFPLDYVWFGALGFLLLAILFASNPKRFIAIFVALAALLALWDQSRWQPWVYQYLFMFAALAFCTWKRSEDKRCATAVTTCRLVMACMYFWSGAQKLNYNFICEGTPYLLRPFVPNFPAEGGALAVASGLLMALTEILIGVGLLTRRFRNRAVVAAVLMHLLILALTIPSRRNSVIWPWNAAMIGFVVVLFWQTHEIGFKEIILNNKHAFHLVVLLLFAVMPALSFFGLWDSFLSFTLFSRNTAQARLYLSERVSRALPPRAQTIVRTRPDASKSVFISDWSFAELNVPPYPEPHIYINAARPLCAHAESRADVVLEIYEKPNILNGVAQVKTFYCDELLGR